MRKAFEAFSRLFTLRDVFTFGGLGLIYVGAPHAIDPIAANPGLIIVGAALFWLGVR